MRALGVDLGSKRIGIAISDSGQSLASPLTVITRSGDTERDHARVGELVEEEEAGIVVIGLPVDLQGNESIAATAVRAEVEQLASALDVPVETWDERMTSAVANKSLAAQGISTKKRRTEIDKFAAAIMLQGWLDARNGS